MIEAFLKTCTIVGLITITAVVFIFLFNLVMAFLSGEP